MSMGAGFDCWRKRLDGIGRAVFFLMLVCSVRVAHAATVVPASLGEMPIGQLSAHLKAGEFARLESTLPRGVSRFEDLLRVKVDEKRRLAIDTWTDSAHWDPKRRRSFFLGQRIFKKFISYDAAANAWAELGWAGEPPSPQTAEYGHTYGRTALDWKRGHYYRLAGGGLMHRYLIDEARWEEIAAVPFGGYISMEWHYGLDMLVAVARSHKVFGFRDGNWKLLGKGSVEGYHSVAQYNPVRRDMMAAGGNNSLRSVDIIDADGAIHVKRDAPFDIAIKNDSLSYDPQSGNYLMLRLKQRELYEYDPDRDEWRLAAHWGASDWPFGNFYSAVPIEIDELGVILWQSALGPQLYRHRSVFEAGSGKTAATARDLGSGSVAGRAGGPEAANASAGAPRKDDVRSPLVEAPAAKAPAEDVQAAVAQSKRADDASPAPHAGDEAGAEPRAPSAPGRSADTGPHLPPPGRIIRQPVSSMADRPLPAPPRSEPTGAEPEDFERKDFERKGAERKGAEGKVAERKGSERKGSERKDSERKDSERKDSTPARVESKASAATPEAGAGVPAPAIAASPAAVIARATDGRAAGPRPVAETAPPAKLARILEKMKPGEWRHIPTVLPEGHATLYDTLSTEFCPRGSGKRTHGNGWLDSFVYDPVSRSFFILLMRDSSEKRLAWLDADLVWHYVTNPPGIDSCAFNRRAFNRLTLVDGSLYWLPARWGANRVQVGKFVRAPVADFVANGSGKFEPYGVGVGITSMGQAGDYAVEWFPEAAAWILHLPGNETRDTRAAKWSAPSGHTAQGTAEEKPFGGRLFLYRPDDKKWTYLDRTYSQGYRSRILYNPIKRELLIAPGGYGPANEFTRITAAGEIIKLDGARLDSGEKVNYHTGRDDLTYDPVSGDYLLWSYGSKRIWRSGDGVRWETYEDFAGIKFNGPQGLFGASSFIQVNPIPGTDGLIWFDPHRGVILHRMRKS